MPPMPVFSWFTYDFGYSWPYTLGHALVLGFALVALAAAWRLAWPRWARLVAAAVAVWGLEGMVTMHHAVQINVPQRLPTERFLPGGPSRVLDLGAGSGRASIGVLLARPDATVTALDRYEGYYGIDDNTPDRLQRNAARAGVSNRLTVQVADMRTLPFEPRTFDAAISVAALDHLDWPGIRQTLHEVERVLRPGGQLLIVGLNPDVWVRMAIPSSIHGGYWGTAQNMQRWRNELQDAGFTVDEAGTQPATVYLLAHLAQ